MRFLRCWQRPVPNFTPTPRFPRSPLTGSGSHWRNRIKPSTRDISLWKTMGLDVVGGGEGAQTSRPYFDTDRSRSWAAAIVPGSRHNEMTIPRRLGVSEWPGAKGTQKRRTHLCSGARADAPFSAARLTTTRRLSKSCNLVSVHPAERGMHADNTWIGCVLCSVQNMWFTKNDVRLRIKCFCESTESCSSSLAEQGRERRGVMLTHQCYK